VLLGYVSGNGRRFFTGRRQFLGCAGQRLGIDIVDDKLAAFCR
jgi:hypothetical protein